MMDAGTNERDNVNHALDAVSDLEEKMKNMHDALMAVHSAFCDGWLMPDTSAMSNEQKGRIYSLQDKIDLATRVYSFEDFCGTQFGKVRSALSAVQNATDFTAS